MLLDELQQALDLVVAALESEDSACPSTAVPHFEQAHTVLSYARACTSAELDPANSNLVDQVCQGLLNTLEARLQVLRHMQCAPTAVGGIQGAPADRFSDPGCSQPQGCCISSSNLSESSRGLAFKQHFENPSAYNPAWVNQLPANAMNASNRPGAMLQQQQQDAVCSPDPHLLMLSDDELDNMHAVGSSAAAAESVEIMHQCQRSVTGSLNDIAGLESVKQELRQAVLWPLRLPHLFRGYRKPPKSFLMVGPPGTGKTMLVEKVAAESGMVLLAVSPSAVLSKWSGESEKTIRAVFAAASSMQPSIVFIDEVDALAGQRASNDDAASRRLLTELLIQMTAATEQDSLYVFACTNRIQDCDAALLRRFERRILIPLPDAATRHAFFAKALMRPEMDHTLSAEDIRVITEKTEGYSCSDLASVCKDAAMAPVRDLLAQHATGAATSQTKGSSKTASGKASKRTAGEQQEPLPLPCQGIIEEETLQAADLRRLCLQDFTAALELIKTTAADQAKYALP